MISEGLRDKLLDERAKYDSPPPDPETEFTVSALARLWEWDNQKAARHLKKLVDDGEMTRRLVGCTYYYRFQEGQQ